MNYDRRRGDGSDRRATVVTAVGLVGTAMAFSATSAHAYIDPSAGGTLVQFLAGGVIAGVLMFGRLFWSSIKSTFSLRRFRGRSADDKDKPQTQAP